MTRQDEREICSLFIVHNTEKIIAAKMDDNGNTIIKLMLTDYNCMINDADNLERHLHTCDISYII